MGQIVHALHLLLARHFVPILLADAQNLHLLFARHCGPLERVLTIGARQGNIPATTIHSPTHGLVPSIRHSMHHALAIFANKFYTRAIVEVDVWVVVITIVVCLVIVTVTVVLATGLSFGTATTADLSWILLVPSLFLLGRRLDDTNQKSSVHLIKFIGLLHGAFQEEKVFF